MRYEYTIMGQVIKNTKEEKDLGVFFCDNFKPKLNCDKVSKSASRKLGMIRRNISDRSSESMIILYKTLVRPILDYCITAWRPYLKKDELKLEKIQRRYTKLIDGCKDLSYENRLSKLGLTTLSDRFFRADMIQVYKILNDKNSTFPKNFLELNVREGRRNTKKIFKKGCNLDICKFSFTSRVVDPWNALPDDIVTSQDVNSFKSNFDNWLRDTRGHP